MKRRLFGLYPHISVRIFTPMKHVHIPNVHQPEWNRQLGRTIYHMFTSAHTVRLVGVGRAIVKDYYYKVLTRPEGEEYGEGGS